MFVKVHWQNEGRKEFSSDSGRLYNDESNISQLQLGAFYTSDLLPPSLLSFGASRSSGAGTEHLVQ